MNMYVYHVIRGGKREYQMVLSLNKEIKYLVSNRCSKSLNILHNYALHLLPVGSPPNDMFLMYIKNFNIIE